MKRCVLLILCVALLLCGMGCREQDPTPQKDPVSTPETSGPNQYVVDPVINRFILEFEKQERYVMAGLVQNTDLSCVAYIDMCQVTMRATERGLCFSIVGGNTEDLRDRMLDIFYSIAQVVDPSCTDQQAQSAVDHLTASDRVITHYKVSADVTVDSYVPLASNPTVQVDSRMDFTALGYGAEE